MSVHQNKLAYRLQCNVPLNRKALCLKRSWDEVSAILDKACAKKCPSSQKKKHH